jgi:hypothetical protein
MPKVAYVSKKFSAGSIQIIAHALKIIEEYAAEGYDLTLRQLYYQFVSRDPIRLYSDCLLAIRSIVNDARLAGHIDWSSIVDRTRNVRRNAHWSSPDEIVKAAAEQYQVDKWDGQEWRPEVWIEKDALVGVIEQTCNELDVPFFSCRGYVSQSETWSAAMRFRQYESRGQRPIIIHLGDHDPSGIDMTRDIQDRMTMFGSEVEVLRIALNYDQVEEYGPPPNPTKLTDSRAGVYLEHHGRESWELDALEPKVLNALVQGEISERMDAVKFAAAKRKEELSRKKILQSAKALASKPRKKSSGK